MLYTSRHVDEKKSCTKINSHTMIQGSKYKNITDSRFYVTTVIDCNDRINIDNILYFSNKKSTILYSFSIVAQLFTKYKPSFNLSKCDFLKIGFEYVDHELTTHDNYSAVSKFQLIQDWFLPRYLTSFLFFIKSY